MQALQLGGGWFENLSSNDKGDLGEVFARMVLREALREDPTAFFEDDVETVRSNPHLPKHGRPPQPIACWEDDGVIFEVVRTHQRPRVVRVGPDGEREEYDSSFDFPTDRCWWEPDVRFSIVVSKDDQEFVKEILCEVKTGKYAEFGRSQKSSMLMANRNPDRVILLCRVLFSEEGGHPQLRFRKLDVDDRANRARWTDLTSSFADVLPADSRISTV